MVGNKKYPISSLTHALVRDAAAMYHQWTFETSSLQVEKSPACGTHILGTGKLLVPTVKFVTQLVTLCTCCSNLTVRRSCTTHTTAMVYGVKVHTTTTLLVSHHNTTTTTHTFTHSPPPSHATTATIHYIHGLYFCVCTVTYLPNSGRLYTPVVTF